MQEALVPVCGEFHHTNTFDNYQILMLFSYISRYCIHIDHSLSGFAHFNLS
jgi:hypothetical protein